MPHFDKTGPQGKDPRTGRIMGPCAQTDKLEQRTGKRRGMRRGHNK